MKKIYTEEELQEITKIAQNDAYIKKEEAVQIAFQGAKIREPYPDYDVDFGYERGKENSFEARYTVSFTIDGTTYSYSVKATTGEIISSNRNHFYKGNFLKEGVAYLKYADETNFTSDIGMKIRRRMYEPLKKPLLKATDGNIYLEEITRYGSETVINTQKDLSYLCLEENKPYIFVSTHSFCEDVNAALSIVDRNAYLLFGSTDQLEHAKQVYGLWAMGMVYVNRLDPWSRANAFLKMKRLIENGTSVIICVEGGYNNTENKIVDEFFEGAVKLNKETSAPIVPLASFRESGQESIYITANDPINYLNVRTEEGTMQLRDTLATLEYELWHHHATRLKRCELPKKARWSYLEERKEEYTKNKWTHDVWEEELTVRENRLYPDPNSVWETFSKVKITKKNDYVMKQIMAWIKEANKYNFKRFMKKSWALEEYPEKVEMLEELHAYLKTETEKGNIAVEEYISFVEELKQSLAPYPNVYETIIEPNVVDYEKKRIYQKKSY